mmetsp:Transcript_6078/g.12182  ORF Transcript_6078/g.12182 Transcript_6078/m.12182 type:complete len:172 (+) Transcript_6078:1932-2447(+)
MTGGVEGTEGRARSFFGERSMLLQENPRPKKERRFGGVEGIGFVLARENAFKKDRVFGGVEGGVAFVVDIFGDRRKKLQENPLCNNERRFVVGVEVIGSFEPSKLGAGGKPVCCVDVPTLEHDAALWKRCRRSLRDEVLGETRRGLQVGWFLGDVIGLVVSMGPLMELRRC